MKNNTVNYYIEMDKHSDLSIRWHEVSSAKSSLSLDDCHSWCKEDKELDSLRREAFYAMDRYADALFQRVNKIERDICDELYGRKKRAGFWEKNFKRRGL